MKIITLNLKQSHDARLVKYSLFDSDDKYKNLDEII
jgi:hypothetical protein